MKAFFNWSGGKDSALALYKARQEGIPVKAVVTSLNTAMDRVSMHGVRRSLLERQAAYIGLPMHTIEVPEMPSMTMYEEAVCSLHQQLKQDGFTHGIFGDIFLEDLKKYREDLLAQDDLKTLFPLWATDTRHLLKQFMDAGFKAIIVCVNSTALDKSFCGRLLDESFLHDLPATVDPCGENGEYHSFVFDGPLFSQPISFTKGKIVFKEYAAPIIDAATPANQNNNDCFTAPQPAAGFYFQDLLPA